MHARPALGALLALALMAPAPPRSAAAEPRVEVLEGVQDFHFEPTRARGTLLRTFVVVGATRERVVRGLRGPATGPLGVNSAFVSDNPPRSQLQGDELTVVNVRMKGAPRALGSTVRARFTPDGMVGTMSEGMVGGEFRVVVGPEHPDALGRPRVEVSETGSFWMLREPPRSLLGMPRFMFMNLTPFGWIMQAAGGTAVSAGHLRFFALERAMEVRLNSGLPAYSDL